MSHSEIHGSTPVCGFPWLIATCYVLHRLLAPRHSPNALSSLITKLTYQPLARSIETQRTVICPKSMCSCQRTIRTRVSRGTRPGADQVRKNFLQVVGVTGFEPVTLRLSSACSNQLSYTPESSSGCGVRNAEFQTPHSELRIPHFGSPISSTLSSFKERSLQKLDCAINRALPRISNFKFEISNPTDRPCHMVFNPCACFSLERR